MRTALVLGASGGIGGEAAAALVRHGWQVRGFARSRRKAPDDIAWISGDALNAAQVASAAHGTDVIIHAVAPRSGESWDAMLPMLDNTIAAAKANSARIVFPGSLYAYGRDAFPQAVESAIQKPTTKKGRILAEMERRLEQASREGVRVLIVRSGNYFGPRAGTNWFSQLFVKPHTPLTHVTEPGTRGTMHAWAYLPDVAEVIAELLERDTQLAQLERFHYAGHEIGAFAMADALKRALGKPELPVKKVPWLLVTLLSPFVRSYRELASSRGLWRITALLDGAKLQRFLGKALRRTPLDVAVRDTMRAYGLLGEKRTLAEIGSEFMSSSTS